MNKTLIAFLAVLGIALIIASQAFFIVDQREQAIVLQLGNPVGNPKDKENFIKNPGIHVKIPLIQDVIYFDRRILSVDPPPEQVVISSANQAVPKAPVEGEAASTEVPAIEDISGEPIIVDTFGRYRITDPLQFYKTLRTKEVAESRLEIIVKEATKATLGKTTLRDLLSEKRGAVMTEIRDRVNAKIAQDNLGLKIVDVRIVRADLTSDLLVSTVRRMISELKERATDTRSRGEERALEIRSTADKERSILLAEAERTAQVVRGEGDKAAIKVYADSFQKDPEFYSFIRSMEAYRNTLANPETRLILSPDSDFFRYFGKNALSQ